MTDDKRFDEWMSVKEGLHLLGKYPQFNTGDVWWCGIGENVGVEINGKSERFSRPVLILKKLSRHGFMGVPLTSQPHEGTWYANFIFQERLQYAALAQARTMSVSRLYNKMGQLPLSDLDIVREAFKKLYLG